LDVVADVEFSYPEDEQVVYAIPAGLALHTDEAWCLRGVSGSGKSTLMTLLATLRRFRHGHICYRFDESSPVDVSPAKWKDEVGPALWRRIGFAFQRPELIRALNVRDNLALVRPDGDPHATALFDGDEWRRIAGSRVWEISGGQVQRLGLVRAFGDHQSLVFLDEPTNNLDRRNRATVAQFVEERRRGRALVVVSHDDEFVATLDVDRVFEIRERTASDGRVRRTLATACQKPATDPEIPSRRNDS
jgi:putative ABC transport system ATP-binding protein